MEVHLFDCCALALKYRLSLNLSNFNSAFRYQKLSPPPKKKVNFLFFFQLLFQKGTNVIVIVNKFTSNYEKYFRF